MSARGTVVKRRGKWAVVIDLGLAPGCTCTNENNRNRHWEWTTSATPADCSECGAPLGPVTQQRRRKWHGPYPTKKVAEEERTSLLGKLDKGEYVPPSRLTLRQFAEAEWLPSIDALVAGGNMKPTTAFFYRTQVTKYVVPRIGDVLLKDITAPMLNTLYGDLLSSGQLRREGGLSTTSVRLVHVTTHRMLGDAVRWGHLSRNVADQDDAPRPRKTGKDTMRTWSPQQLGTFLEAVRGDRLYALWVTLVTTGLRRGEIAGFRWSDLDLPGGRLQVENTRVLVNHAVVEGAPKTEKSRRSLGLDPVTVTVLRAHQKRQKEEKMAWGPAYHQTGLCFTHEEGRPLHPYIISRTFGRLAKAAKLPVIRLHDLRHSYASAALEAGVPLKVVSDRLGHSSIAITADTYSHVRPEVDQAAAENVAGVIFGA